MSKELLRLSIADEIDNLRARRDWGFRRLAREAGISGQTLFSLLKGRNNTRLSTLEALATALECEVRVSFRPRRQQGDITKPTS